MQLFFDVSCLAQEQLTGIGVYTKSLYSQLKNISDDSVTPICSLSRIKNRSQIETHIDSKLPLNLFGRHLPSELKLIHFPDHHLINMPAQIKVQTIHDVGPLENQDFSDVKFRRRFQKRFDQIFKNPTIDRYIAVSHFTKSRVLHFYPHLVDRIDVVHLGAEPLAPKIHPLNHSGGVASREIGRPYPWPYLLCVGTLENRKNTLGLIRAFTHLAAKYPDLRLVLIGKEGYGSEKSLEAIDSHPFKDRIVWRKFVGPRELMSAYRFAEVFVFPSSYEGFGLPILEAMQLGCPVVCSNIPTLVEIGGDAIRTFDPLDTHNMAQVIDSVFSDASLRYLLKRRAKANASLFTWEKCARKTWGIYMNLLRERIQEDLPSLHWESAAFRN